MRVRLKEKIPGVFWPVHEYARDPRTGEVLPGYPDVNNHHIDAVRYALEGVWRRRGN